MLQIAVCNKDLDFMKQIEQWISKEIRKQKLSVETICFRSGDELLWGMELDGGYDLIFMNLVSQNDIDVARNIIAESPHCLIVFIADDAAMVYDTFDVHPFAFIKKPVERKQLIKVYYDAIRKIGEVDEVFRVDDIQRIHHQIPLHDILYFQSDRRIIRLFHRNGEELLFYNRLSDVEEYIKTLSTNFVRIHQSYLINRLHVRKFKYREIEIMNGIILPVSDTKRKLVRERFRYGNMDVT